MDLKEQEKHLCLLFTPYLRGNMKNAQINIIRIIFCAIFITNCTNNSANKEKLFTELYEYCEMNTLLKMSFVGKLYEGDRGVNFSLEPTSNISVIFPSGFNIKLLLFDVEEGEWVEIKNNDQYFPVDAKYIVGRNDPTKEYDYSLITVSPGFGKKSSIRIVLYGHTYENGIETDRCAGAYLDFEFTP